MDVRKILIVRTSALGDVVQALPVVRVGRLDFHDVRVPVGRVL